jgi:hypothetical protein
MGGFSSALAYRLGTIVAFEKQRNGGIKTRLNPAEFNVGP